MNFDGWRDYLIAWGILILFVLVIGIILYGINRNHV
jgi:hypothetical protein